jgi:hypothetical protein
MKKSLVILSILSCTLLLIGWGWSREKKVAEIPSIFCGEWTEAGLTHDGYLRKNILINQRGIQLKGKWLYPDQGIYLKGDLDKITDGKGSGDLSLYFKNSVYYRLFFRKDGTMEAVELLRSGEYDQSHSHGLYSKVSN